VASRRPSRAALVAGVDEGGFVPVEYYASRSSNLRPRRDGWMDAFSGTNFGVWQMMQRLPSSALSG
jgi:hypothetical protein